MSNVWNVKREDGSGGKFEIAESIDPIDGEFAVTVDLRDADDKQQKRIVQLVGSEATMLALMLLEAARTLGERKAKIDHSRSLAAERERNRVVHRDDVSADDKPAIERPAKPRGPRKNSAKVIAESIAHGVRADTGEMVKFRMLGRFTAGADTLVYVCRVCGCATLSQSTREVPCSGEKCKAPGTAFAGVLVEGKEG